MGEAVERQSLIEKTTKARPKTFICLDRAFGGNDQLETNTSLQIEHEGIAFTVISQQRMGTVGIFDESMNPVWLASS